MRCLGLGRSIIIPLFWSWHLILPKDHSHTVKIARIFLYLLFIVMAYCMVLLFPLGRNRVTYLYCLYAVFKVHRRDEKNLLLISRKMRVFALLFPKTFKPKKRPLLQPISENFFNFFIKMIVRIKSPSLISRTKKVLYAGFCKISDSL